MKRSVTKLVAGIMAAAVAFSGMGMTVPAYAASIEATGSDLLTAPSWDKAVELKAGQEVKDTVKHKAFGGSEAKLYKFKMPKSGHFNVTAIKYSDSDSISVNVYKGPYTASTNKNDYLVWKDSMKSGNTLISPELAPAEGETYYVEVDSSSLHSVNFAIRINMTEAANWETEDNDTMDKADQLNSGKVIYGYNVSNTDVDWYKFDMSADGYATFKLVHDFKSEDRNSYAVEVYNSNKTQVYYGLVNNLNKTFESGKLGLSKGTYFVKVSTERRNYLGKYGLTVTAKKDSGFEKELNDSFDTANVLKLGSAVKGTTISMGGNKLDEADYYKFSVSKPTNLFISLSHVNFKENTTAWSVTLYDANRKEVTGKGFEVLNNKAYNGTGEIVLEKGTYFVKVSYNAKTAKHVYNQDYTLAVNAKLQTPAVKLKALGKKKIKVSWNKVSGASGYVIYRSTSKKGAYKAVKTITKGSTVSFTNTKLKKGKKYFYKVIAFKTVGGTREYSSYSAVKSVKVK